MEAGEEGQTTRDERTSWREEGLPSREKKGKLNQKQMDVDGSHDHGWGPRERRYGERDEKRDVSRREVSETRKDLDECDEVTERDLQSSQQSSFAVELGRKSGE